MYPELYELVKFTYMLYLSEGWSLCDYMTMFPTTRSRSQAQRDGIHNVAVNSSSNSSIDLDLSNQAIFTLAQKATQSCSVDPSYVLVNKTKPQKRLGSKQTSRKHVISTKLNRSANISRSKNTGKTQLFPIFSNNKTDQNIEPSLVDMSGLVLSQSSQSTADHDRSFSDVLHDALVDSQENATLSGSDSEEDEGRGARHAMDRRLVDSNPRDQFHNGSASRPVGPNPRDQSPRGSAGPSHASPSGDDNPEVEYLRSANLDLINQLKDVEGQLSNSDKLCKRQKLTIKKLKSQNDELRKSLSSHTGIKKLLKSKSVGVGDSSVIDIGVSSSEIEELLATTQSALDLANVKHDSLKTHISVLTSNMFAALDDDFDKPTPSSKPEAAPQPNISNPRQAKRSRGKPVDIDVTFSDSGSNINFQNQNPTNLPPSDHDIPSYAQAESYKEVLNPKKIVVGSSLARGTSEALKHCGVDVSEYYYSGGHIPYMAEPIKRILERNPQVESVVCIMGGNDCESDLYYLEEIVHNYDCLIDMIKLTLGSDCTVIISSIPQRRRCSARSHIRIAKLNEFNKQRENSDYGVFYVDAAPRFGNHFYDRVHMNNIGLDHWAQNMSDKMNSISNFQKDGSITRL